MENAGKQFIHVSYEGQGKREQLQQRAARFGNSLEILDYDNTVEQHIEHLNLLPDAFVERMKEKNLRIVLGTRDSVWEMMRETKGLKYRLDDIKRTFLSLVNKKFKEHYKTEALGLYEEWLKTAFVSGYRPEGSVALHEYGHGVGGLLKIEGYRSHEHPSLIHEYELISDKLSLEAIEGLAELGDATAAKELFAEAFEDFFTIPKNQFISFYSRGLYDFIGNVIINGS